MGGAALLAERISWPCRDYVLLRFRGSIFSPVCDLNTKYIFTGFILIDMAMNVSPKILLEFAHELHRVVADFEEEMEILANGEMMDEFEKNDDAFRKGDVVEFSSIEDLREL